MSMSGQTALASDGAAGWAGLSGPVPTARADALPAGPMEDGTPLSAYYLVLPPARKTDAPVQPAPARQAAAADAAPSPSAADPLAETEPEDPAASTEPVESLRDNIVAALKGNPDIQISLAQQDDARYGVHEAWSGYLPRVDLSVGYGPEISRVGSDGDATTEFRTEASATLTQNIWDFGVTTNDIARARAVYRSAQWATREQIESIAYDITNNYLGLLQQQKLVDLAKGEIAATKRILRMVTIQKDLGLTSAADVSRAQARLDNVQSQLLDRQSALQQARDAYKRLTGHLPGRAVDLPPTTEKDLPPTVDAAVEMIDERSPRMAQALEDRKSLAKQYAGQTGTFFPHVSLLLQGNHKYDVQGATGLTRDARAVVQLTYSFNGGADYATRKRLGARLREADYELERRRREVETDLRADFEALRAARAKIDTINSEIGQAAKVADLYRQQFREGKRSVFDLLDSQQVLYTARSNAVANQIAMNAAEYRVLQKLGGLFDLVSSREPLPPLVMPAPVKPRARKQ